MDWKLLLTEADVMNGEDEITEVTACNEPSTYIIKTTNAPKGIMVGDEEALTRACIDIAQPCQILYTYPSVLAKALGTTSELFEYISLDELEGDNEFAKVLCKAFHQDVRDVMRRVIEENGLAPFVTTYNDSETIPLSNGMVAIHD